MILLIDDSDSERALIRKMLEIGGHEVRDAADGDDGVALFSQLEPDLVICDLMMPQKDGFATVAEMQSHSPDAKIIAMSGVWYGTADHRAMAKSLGLVAVIEKPFQRAALLKLVKKTLTRKSAPKRKRIARPARARPAKATRPKSARAKSARAKSARVKSARAKTAPKRTTKRTAKAKKAAKRR